MYAIISKDNDIRVIGHIKNSKLFTSFVYNWVMDRYRATILNDMSIDELEDIEDGYYLLVTENKIKLVNVCEEIKKGYIWDDVEKSVKVVNTFFLAIDDTYKSSKDKNIKSKCTQYED